MVIIYQTSYAIHLSIDWKYVNIGPKICLILPSDISHFITACVQDKRYDEIKQLFSIHSELSVNNNVMYVILDHK